MSTLNNYPAGAMCDRSAPYAQPMRDDDTRCEFDHPDGEDCEGHAPHTCRLCGMECCDAAMVVVRSEWRGRIDHEAVCLECAVRDHLTPASTKEAIGYLRRALNHELASHQPGSMNYSGVVNVFADAFGLMARERIAAEDAILRFGAALKVA